MKIKLNLWVGLILLTACMPATAAPLPQPTVPPLSPIPAATQTPILTGTQTPVTPSFTAIPTLTPAVTVIVPAFCADPQPVTLINSLKTSMLTSDGLLLSSLVHPSRGMDVRYFRDGKVVNYTPEQSMFLFETTFEADWGNEPGSGLPKKGAFHDVIVPSLVEIFSQPYTLHCNELKYGGATYNPVFPYENDYYSIHFTGTDQYGFLDWHTWAVGMAFENNKPYIYALIQFFWEP